MKKVPAWVILCVVALVAGLALGVTNALTEERIADQARRAAEAARAEVLPAAANFELVTEDDPTVDNCYKGVDASGNVVGYVAQITVTGFGGPIEVTLGVGADGKLTGVKCGGSAFSETPGLGAKVRDAQFSEQFAGMAAPVALTKNGGNVDSVTAASISSGAVCDAINQAAAYIAGIA